MATTWLREDLEIPALLFENQVFLGLLGSPSRSGRESGTSRCLKGTEVI